MKGQSSCVQVLLFNGHLQHGPSARDKRGSTALHYASKAGHVATALMLAGAGFDRHLKNAEGRTPLDLAEGQLRKLWEHELSKGSGGGGAKHASERQDLERRLGTALAKVKKERKMRKELERQLDSVWRVFILGGGSVHRMKDFYKACFTSIVCSFRLKDQSLRDSVPLLWFVCWASVKET